MILRFLNGRATALVAILIFIVAKISHLFYAFYWDESWVYAPAIKLMYVHGPSLLPDAIPFEYSRGHPLLYHAACAMWMRVFGNSNVVMHSFALSVSVVLAVSVYECIRRLFGARCAVISLILLLLNLAFYASASFVLTDIPLALFAFLALYAYCEERYIWASVFMALLFLVKESGIVLTLIVGVDILVDLFNRKRSWRLVILKSLTLIFSILPLAVLLVAQKVMFGWYVNPGHTSLMHLGIGDTLEYFRRSLRFLLFTNNAFLPVLLLMIMLVWGSVTRRSPGYLFAVIISIVVYLHILFFSYKDVVFYVFAVLILIGWIIFVIKPLVRFTKEQQRFIKLAISFTVVYVYFCCINFFEERYLFPATLLTILLLGICYDRILENVRGQWAFAVILVILIASGVINLSMGKGDLDVYDRMKVQQNFVGYLEQLGYYDKNIYTKSYLAQIHLENPNTGFRVTSPIFAHVSDTLDSNTDLAAFDNIEFDVQYEITKQDSNFVLLHHYQVNDVWVDVFGRKQSGFAIEQ